jgi:hypothetical protein
MTPVVRELRDCLITLAHCVTFVETHPRARELAPQIDLLQQRIHRIAEQAQPTTRSRRPRPRG